MPWTVESDDQGGASHYEIDADSRNPTNSFPTELEAVNYAIDCLEGRREGLRSSLRTLQRRRKTIKRRRPTPQQNGGGA